jgi:hypothetical protein
VRDRVVGGEKQRQRENQKPRRISADVRQTRLLAPYYSRKIGISQPSPRRLENLRPDVRENARQLGALVREFDFDRQPRNPFILPEERKTA